MSINDPLASLYPKLNWRVPGTTRCEGCKDIAWPPTAGCYPSALEHYEALLGPLPGARTSLRLLILFQDPRPTETNFVSVDPDVPTASLSGDQHRYFCLSPIAWSKLGLDARTDSPRPVWPTATTAPFFLKRYLQRRGPWSYDGFLAYFLCLLRPQSAVITDVAKCHFGEKHSREILMRCAGIHLRAEAELARPNLVLSFSNQFDDKIAAAAGPSLRDVPVLRLLHPAAWMNKEQRRDRFLDQLAANEPALAGLGVDVQAVRDAWTADVARVLAGG